MYAISHREGYFYDVCTGRETIVLSNCLSERVARGGRWHKPPNFADVILPLPQTRPKMLLLWLTGAAMRHVETLSDEEIKFDAVNLINRFLSKDYPNLPPPEEILVHHL